MSFSQNIFVYVYRGFISESATCLLWDTNKTTDLALLQLSSCYGSISLEVYDG